MVVLKGILMLGGWGRGYMTRKYSLYDIMVNNLKFFQGGGYHFLLTLLCSINEIDTKNHSSINYFYICFLDGLEKDIFFTSLKDCILEY